MPALLHKCKESPKYRGFKRWGRDSCNGNKIRKMPSLNCFVTNGNRMKKMIRIQGNLMLVMIG
ncbi:hypothetical protein AN965_00260 [Alkalicoccobacillus plakortidis]|uniref:Uncharacterized protein n=1 Tax=Alkalicoccobacillus plakortidis TaxID=444060 RepID=A0A9D5I2T1_9BACI|nr:hypothetical protein AN965_00260 [Alkalicoccobacillus plakortidis]